MEYTTFKQKTYQGIERTIYKTIIGKTRYQTDSLEKLKIFVDNHREVIEGTFK